MAIYTVANFKGGSGKSTTAFHLASYLQTLGSAILADGDKVRASLKWSMRGPGVPFKVVPVGELTKEMRKAHYDHVIIDTEANPSDNDFNDIANGCDLLIITEQRDEPRDPPRHCSSPSCNCLRK
jgi:chromosome partitioning protein